MSQFPSAHLFAEEDLPRVPNLAGQTSPEEPRKISFGNQSRGASLLTDVTFSQKNSIGDVATGGFVEFGRLASAAAGRFTPGEDIFEDWSKSLGRLKAENPHWQPQQIESAWDLLTHPDKLLEQVVGQAPYMAANMGMMLAGFATGGPVGAALSVAGPFALSFAIEGQSAYEQAIEYGATPGEAEFAGNVTGAISGLLEVMQIGGIVRFGKGVKNNLIRSAAQRALSAADGLFTSGLAKPTMELAKEMATQSVQEMLQGTTNEVVAFQVYGKKIEEDFLDRRLQEAIGASASSLMFGAGMRGVNQVVGGKPVLDAAMKSRDTSSPVYDAYAFAGDLKNKFGYNEEEVSAVLAVTDARAYTWSQATGKDASEWYATHLAGSIANVEPGDVLYQDANSVGEMYLKSQKIIRESMQDKLTAKQALAFLQKNKVSKEEMVWTGTWDFLQEHMESDKSIAKEDLLKVIEETDFSLKRDVLGVVTEEDVKIRDTLNAAEYKAFKAHDSHVYDLIGSLLKNKNMSYSDAVRINRTVTDTLYVDQFYEVMTEFQSKLSEDEQKHLLKAYELLSEYKTVEERGKGFRQELMTKRTKWAGFASQRTGGENYREILIRLPSSEIAERAAHRQVEQKQKELDAAGTPNDSIKFPSVPQTHWGKDYGVVAIRTTDRIDKKSGNKVLFVEEIQSDWSQKYRRREALLKPDAKPDERTTQDDIDQAKKYGSLVQPPYLNTHRELAIKQLLQVAVQQGYEQISFQRGDVSAEMNMREDAKGRKLSYDVLLPKAIDQVLEDLGVSKSLRQTAIHDYVLSSPSSMDETLNNRALDADELYKQSQTDGTPVTADFITLKITPELARRVNEGMPLFQKGNQEFDLPAVPQGHTRLYRGNTSLEKKTEVSAWIKETPEFKATVDATGRWFTPSLESAKAYSKEGNGRVTYIDVPTDQLESMDGQNQPEAKQFQHKTIGKGEEYFLSRELADRAQEAEPKTERTLNQEGNSIPFSGPRASVQFLADGRAVIKALKNPDITSALHELMHVFRRDLYSLMSADPKTQNERQINEDIATLESTFKVKNGEWTVDQEEALATAWEKWLSKGQAPNQPLISVFDKMKTWFKKVYATIVNSPLDTKLNKNLIPVFERLLSPDRPEVSAKRVELQQAQIPLRKARSERLGLKPSDQQIAEEAYRIWEEMNKPQGLDNEIWIQAEAKLNEQAGEPLKAANDAAKKIMLELRDLLETSTPKDFARSLAQGDPNVIDFLQTESIETRHHRGILSRAKDKISTFVSMALPLKRTKAGRMTLEVLGNMQAEVQTLMGQFAEPIARSVGQLTKADWNWLYADPGNRGLPNLVRMVDQTGVPADLQVSPPNPRLAYLRQMIANIQDTTGRAAEEVGVMQHLQDGSLQPFKRPKYLKLPRIPTDDMWQALSAKSGPMYDALKAEILKLNPDIKTLGSKDEILIGPYGDLTVKRSRALEESRTIPVMPYYVYVNGKAIEVFRTNPLDLMTKAVDFQARRIAYVKSFGLAGSLNEASLNPIKKFVKLMGINMGKPSDDVIKQRMLDAGMSEESLVGLEAKELRVLAKENKIPLGWTKSDYVSQLKKLNPNKFNQRQNKLTLALAKGLKGVNLRQDTFGILQDTIKRVEDPMTDLVGELRSKHVQEAGYEGAGQIFDDVLTVWQGLPYHWFKRSTSTRMLRASSNLIGALQTSLSVAPNIPQTLALVPKFTGLKNYLQAVSDVMKDPYMTRSQVAALGAFPLAVNSWALEKGYFVEGIARNVRQFFGEATGLRVVSELNNTIAGQAGRLMVGSWRSAGVTEGDIAIARQLGLNDNELQSLRNKNVSDEIEAKIVQRLVASTQFVTEAPHLKGKVENIPLLRIMFSYANYTMGQTRAMFDMMGQWKNVVKNMATGKGSWSEGFRAIHATLANVTGMMGAGVAGLILRQALKGQLTGGEEEELEDRMLGGLVEVQLFGAAQRMLEPFNHSNGIFEQALIGTMPHLKAVSDGAKALLQMDKYADFDLGERVMAAGKKNFPLFSAISGRKSTEVEWLENFAYPELQGYNQTKIKSWKWIEEQPVVSRYAKEGIKERKGAGFSPINPDYDRVYQWVIRGQKLEAKEAVREFVEKVRSERGDVGKELSNLRRSLMVRSPIPMNARESMKFLRGLPEEKRIEAKQADRAFVRLVNRVAPSF